MRTLIILPLLLFAGSAPAEPMDAVITGRCKARWPHDYSMQLHCIREQTENALEVVGLLKGEAAEGDLRDILAVCFTRWGGSAEKADWPMVAFCYKQERQAWTTVKGIERN